MVNCLLIMVVFQFPFFSKKNLDLSPIGMVFKILKKTKRHTHYYIFYKKKLELEENLEK